MDYLEKLRDPRWQKKRLEIFERDGWRCKSCAAKNKSLHVHHLFYFKDKEPWEMENGFLLTLCEECHSNKKEPDEDCNIKDGIRQDIGLLLDTIWKAGYDYQDLIEIAHSISKSHRPIGPPTFTLNFTVTQWKWDENNKKWEK